MSQVLIRNVDEQIVSRIKERAKRRGVSMQKELRAMLQRDVERGGDDPTGTVYPPLQPARVKGKPASRLLVEDRR